MTPPSDFAGHARDQKYTAGKSRSARQLFLRKFQRQAQAANILADKLAHIHAQSIGGSAERRLSTIVCIRRSASMLDFRTLLELADLNPSEVLVVRHVPVERSLRRVLPWLVVERPDLFLAYQRIQWRTLEKAMTRGRYVAAFVGQEPVTATFAGIYRIGAWETLDYRGYQAFPGNSELEALGMSGRASDMPDCLAFELERLEPYLDWIGRLVIIWPKPYQQWWRWAAGGKFKVEAITPESRFVRGMPDWQELVLGWQELQALPASWATVLAQWRGIYFIYDTTRREGYVGSAYGQENILGRWHDYARTGHGGNRGLRSCNPSALRFSILQRTSPDLDPAEVIALEAAWKERLHTREFGLNRN